MIGRKTALTIANVVVGSVLGLVAMKLAAQYFGKVAIGQAFTALGFLGVVYFITDLGMAQAHIKRVSEGRDPGDCFATYAAFKLVATVLFVLLVCGVFFTYLVVLDRPLTSTTLPILALTLIYYCAKSMQDIGQASFDARQEAARSQLTVLTDTSVRVSLTMLGAFVVAALVHRSGPFLDRLDPDNALWSWVAREPGAALAFASTAGAIIAASLAGFMLLRNFERGRFRWDLLRDYAVFALPLFMMTTITIIASHIDQAVIGLFLDESDAGVFGSVKRIPLFIATLGGAVGILLLPTISALAARGDRDAIFGTMDQTLRYVSMLIMPMLAFTMLFAEPVIVLLLANEFTTGARTMVILCVYVFFSTIANIHGFLLMGTGHPSAPTRIAVASASTLIVLDLVLVPYDIRSLGLPLAGLGIDGAAIATLVSGLVWYGGLRFASARLTGYRERSHWIRHAFAAGLMAAALWTLTFWHPFSRWYDIPLFTALGGALYLLALVLLREFTKDDLAFVRRTIHPVEMLRYVKGELTHKRR